MNRRHNDKYDTPYAPLIAAPLVDFLGASLRGTVLECCAGDGNLAGAIADLRGAKINVIQHDLLTGFDATLFEEWADMFDQIDWTITNPPFNLALPILENAWEFSGVGVAFLLPIGWNEPTTTGTRASKKNGTVGIPPRAPWLIEHADNLRCIMPISPRIRFREGEVNPGTGKKYKEDSQTVAWYVWRKDWSWAEMGIKSPFQYLAGWR